MRRFGQAVAGLRSWLKALGVGFAVPCLFVAAVGFGFSFAEPVRAQNWWPWDAGQDRPPTPSEPVYKAPGAPGVPGRPQQTPYPNTPYPAPQAVPPQGGYSSTAGNARSSICLQLEQRLVQEGQRGSESRNLVPLVQGEIDQLEGQYRNAQQQLDRSCYEYFLFSKTLRRSQKCTQLANDSDDMKRRLRDLETQLQQLNSSSGRSYQDDIVRELARNNCGGTYQQQARRIENGDDWNEGESGGGGYGVGQYGNLGYATYRTICVRLCDGYYFPVSFSTLPNHFERDAEVCQSKCAAPAELFYHQNPGAGVDQAVSAQSNQPYTQLKTAFRYRKEFVQGCSCKMAEYVPDPSQPQPAQQQGALPIDGVGAGVAPPGATSSIAQQTAPRVQSDAALPWAPR